MMTSDPVKAKAIRPVLGEIFRRYVQTHCYHWNVEGPDFRTLHSMFQVQHQTLLEFMDRVAERLRVLGAKAPRTASELLALSVRDPLAEAGTADEMLRNQCAEFLRLIDVLRAAIQVLTDVGDDGTVSVLTDILEWVEKEHWMMSAATK